MIANPEGTHPPGEEIQVDRFARILRLIVEKLQDHTVSEVGVHRLGQVEDARAGIPLLEGSGGEIPVLL